MELQEFGYTFKVEDSNRATLADILTHKVYKKQIKIKEHLKEVVVPKPLENFYICSLMELIEGKLERWEEDWSYRILMETWSSRRRWIYQMLRQIMKPNTRF